MKKAGLLIASALPGIVFGYALLAGILMRRVRPIPIMVLREREPKRRSAGEAAAA